MVGNARWNLAPPAPGLNLGGQPDPNAAYQMPRIPWGQNQAVTMAALGLIGGNTLGEGIQNATQAVPAGLAANTARQRDVYALQEKARTDAKSAAEQAGQRAALNAIIKTKSGMPVTPAEQAAVDAFPELKIKYGMPAERDPVIAEGSLVWDEKTQSYIPAAGGVKTPKTPEVLQFHRDQQNSKTYQLLSATKGAYNSMIKSATVKGGAADLDIIYGVAKLLDPLGAVRDQDTVHIENTAGIDQKLVGFINGFRSGQYLPPETRNGLLQMAKQRMEQLEKQFEFERQQNMRLAERLGFNQDDVIDLENIELFDPSLTVGGTEDPLSSVPSAG